MDYGKLDRATKIRIALRNFDKLLTEIVDNPIDSVDINDILRDYNTLRQELNKTLIEK